MAFETLGLGGVLKFDADAAVSKMHAAERGFGKVEQAADSLGGHIGNLKHSMETFSATELAVGLGLGLGLEQLIHHGIKANEEMHKNAMGMAIVFSAATKQPYEQALELSEAIIPRLKDVAAQTAAEGDAAVGVFQKVAPSLIGLHATGNEMISVTKGILSAVGALEGAGASYDDVSGSVNRLARGVMLMKDPFTMTAKSMGLLKESAQEWAALSTDARLKRILEITNKFNEYNKPLSESFGASWRTLKSLAEETLEEGFSGLFSSIKTTMKDLVDYGMKWKETIYESAAEAGQILVPAFQFLVHQVLLFYGHMRDAYNWLSSIVDKVKSWAGSLGIDFGGVTKSVASFLTQFALLMTVAVPVVTVVSSIGGKFWGLGQLALTVGRFLISALAPVVPYLGTIALVVGILVAAFYAFRQEGETTFETLKRAAMMVWGHIAPLWESLKTLWEPLQGFLNTLWPLVKTIFTSIVTLLRDLVFPLVGSIVTLLMPLVTWIWNLAVGLVSGILSVLGVVVKFITDSINWFMGLGSTVSAVWDSIVSVIVPVATFIWELLSTAFSAIWNVLSAIFYALVEIGNFVVSIFKPLWDGLVEGALLWWNAIKWYGEYLVLQFTPIWEGIRDVIKLVGMAIDEFIVGAIKVAASTLGLLLDGFNAITSLVGSQSDYLVETAKKLRDFGETGKWGRGEEKKAPEAPMDSGGMSLAQKANDASAENMSKMAPKDIERLKDHLKIENKLDIRMNASLNTDGRKTAAATARHKAEIGERAGFTQSPWQRQFIQVTSTETT